MYYGHRDAKGGLQFKPRLGVYKHGTNNVFNPKTFVATSYDWWDYVSKFKGVIVFNAYHYSMQTSGHQSAMRDLLKELGLYKKVVFVSQRESLGKGIVLNELYHRQALAEYRLKGVNKTADYYKDQRDIVKQTQAKIKALKKLGGKSSQTLAQYRKDVVSEERQRLERQRVIAARQREKTRALKNEYKDAAKSMDAIAV